VREGRCRGSQYLRQQVLRVVTQGPFLLSVCNLGHSVTGTNIILSKKHDKPLCRICVEAMQATQRAANQKKGIRNKGKHHPWATTVMTSRHRYIKSQVDSIVLKAARMPSTVSVYRLNGAGERVLIRTEQAPRS
jgi:hypothetical protein